MNSKSFRLFFVALFAVVLVAAFASAVTNPNLVANPTSITQSATGTSVNVTFTLTNSAALAESGITWTGSSSLGTWSLTGLPASVAATFTTSTLTATLNGVTANFTGTVTGNITGTNGNGTVVIPVTLNFDIPTEITACSAVANPGQLKVKKIDFKNDGLSSGTTFGEDDQWFPFEKITADIEIKNDGSDNVDNIEVNWGLWDVQNKEWVIEMDNLKEFKLKDGDSNTVSVDFQIDDNMDMDLADLNDGEHYKFYVTAQGEVDNATSSDTCVSDSETETIVIESDFAILDNLNLPEVMQCGQTYDVSADVWNVGDNDQDEVSLQVSSRESVLKFNQDVTVGDIDAFDKQGVQFQLVLPSNLESKTYNMLIEVHDEDNDVYQNDFNDDDSKFTIPLKVECGNGTSSAVTVSAVLESAAKAGTDLVVKSTIKNNENSLKTFTVGASGYAGWADSVSADQSTLVLNAGESRDVTLTFKVNKGASGPQTFFIETVSGSDVSRQPVSVTIEPRSGFGALGNAFAGGSWPIWLIGLLNVVLIAIIVVVAVKIARRK